jgi:hypothetical protein
MFKKTTAFVVRDKGLWMLHFRHDDTRTVYLYLKIQANIQSDVFVLATERRVSIVECLL